MKTKRPVKKNWYQGIAQEDVDRRIMELERDGRRIELKMRLPTGPKTMIQVRVDEAKVDMLDRKLRDDGFRNRQALFEALVDAYLRGGV